MNVTTKSVLKKLPDNLKLTSIICEAITNSFQANANEVKVNFNTTDLGQSNIFENTINISSLSIEDNGEGFTDRNIKSFNYYMSDLKEQLGCKGIGRFTYLTICEQVKIESFKGQKNISFIFSKSTDEVTPNYIDSKLNKKTVVMFESIVDKHISEDLSNEIKEISNHFIATFMFKYKNKQNVKIIFLKDNKEIATINSSEYGAGFTEDNFSIKDEKFYIYYKKMGATIKGFYCAHERTVKKDTLNIKLRVANGEGLLYFITSDYFNQKVNDTRDSFDIKEENKGFFDSKLDWKTINRVLFLEIDKTCKKVGIDISEKTKKNKEESIKTAPYLAPYIRQSVNMSTSSEIIKEAKERFNNDKEYIRDKRNRSKSDYEERLYSSTQAELAEYIFDREKILLDMKSDIDNPNQKSNETIIHDKIMKRRRGNDSYESYKDNRLWIFDERFMLYTYAYSDTTINKILGIKTRNNNVRPDICIFTKSESEISDIILIELKGSDANGEKNAAGLNELNKYTRKIFEYFKQDNEDVRIWSYLITTLNEESKDDLRYTPGMKFAYTPKGEMFYIYNEHFNATTHIYSLDTMVEDAMARNRLFLDILRGNTK